MFELGLGDQQFQDCRAGLHPLETRGRRFRDIHVARLCSAVQGSYAGQRQRMEGNEDNFSFCMYLVDMGTLASFTCRQDYVLVRATTK